MNEFLEVLLRHPYSWRHQVSRNGYDPDCLKFIGSDGSSLRSLENNDPPPFFEQTNINIQVAKTAENPLFDTAWTLPPFKNPGYAP